MKTQSQLRLYLVSNPSVFAGHEDHQAALEIQLQELVERAIDEKEDPIALIEQYLQLSYNGGNTTDEIAGFIHNSGHMIHAMQNLKDHWDEMDDTLPEVSLKHSGTSRDQAVQVFSEITLRSYLETLSVVYDHQ